MIIEINNTCDLFTVTSENGYIDNIVLADGTKCCHVLELGTNCCEPTLLLPIRSLYTFDYSISACGVDAGLDPDGNYLDILISGIDVGCVETLTYPSTNGVGTTTETNPTDLTFRYSFNQIDISGDIDFTVVITTCSGLTYTLDFTITVTIGDVCNAPVQGAVTTTYPDLPTGVTINVSNQFEIDPTAFGFTGGVFPDGVYYIGLSETDSTGQTVAESNSIFVNCSTTCRVIDILANDTCSDIYLLFDALRYSDNCSTITYQQKCSLWYAIGKELGYFLNTPCSSDTSDCGCNK